MKKVPLISIIVVTKNSAATLQKTLESIKKQTYSNIEVIAIDGASEDKTVEIFKQYEPLLGYLVSEPDKGVYDAMNKGIEAAHGDIIYFLNSNDTFYSKDVCQKVVDRFNSSQALIVYGNIYFKNPENGDANCNCFEGESVYYYGHVKNAKKMFECGICHQVVFYHKKIFEKLGNYDLAYPIYADHEFNIRAWKYAGRRISYLNETIANFELGGLSTNKKFKERQEKDHVAIYKKHIAFASKIKSFYFFSLLIWKVVSYSETSRHYLFGFIPVLKVRG